MNKYLTATILSLLLSTQVYADSMSMLIDNTTNKKPLVYEVVWEKDGVISKGLVNATSIEQTMLTIKQQIKIVDKDVVSIKLVKQPKKQGCVMNNFKFRQIGRAHV